MYTGKLLPLPLSNYMSALLSLDPLGLSERGVQLSGTNSLVWNVYTILSDFVSGYSGCKLFDRSLSNSHNSAVG